MLKTAVLKNWPNCANFPGKEWQFAYEFAAFSRAKYCVPVADGTVAIQLALEALDIGAYINLVTNHVLKRR